MIYYLPLSGHSIRALFRGIYHRQIIKSDKSVERYLNVFKKSFKSQLLKK